MNKIQPINLDAIVADAGYKIAQGAFNSSKKKDNKSKKSDAENWITKSLGVLQEQGLYAFFLYLKANRNDNPCGILSDESFKLLQSGDINLCLKENDPLEAIRGDLAKRDSPDDLIFVHSLLNQALIYARYHAKALPDPDSSQP